MAETQLPPSPVSARRPGGREKWGAISVSHATVWRILRRHGLSTRARRCALVAGYRAPEPPREPEQERHLEAERPGELVGMDCFFVGRPQGTKGAAWLPLRFTGLSRELETYLDNFNFDRVHHGRLTQGSIPADVVYGARKMEAR